MCTTTRSSILRPCSLFFAYVEIEDEARWEEISQKGISQHWRKYMSEIIYSNPDHSPITGSLIEVFHLD